MFGDVLKKLERSKGLLMQAASIAHFQEAQDARVFWAKDHDEWMERDRKARMLTVADWLSDDQSHITKHKGLQRTRLDLPKSGSWLFKLPVMKDWLGENDSISLIFWLCGIPGAGMSA